MIFGNATEFLAGAVAILTAIIVHEYAHGWMANSFGDPTPRQAGRLTLNPLVHLDPMGTLMLLFFRFGWAKPVPINPAYFRDRRRGMILVSAAGPVSNFLTALVAMALFKVLGGSLRPLAILFALLIRYNIWFGLFNLLPVPPLDGSHMVRPFLRGQWARLYWQYSHYGRYVIILLVVTGVVGFILGPVSNWLINLLDRLTFFLG